MGFVKKAFKAVTKIVGGLFGAAKAPKPQPLALPTPAETANIGAVADAERRRARLASGRASTMLSDQSSYADPTVGRKQLG